MAKKNQTLSSKSNGLAKIVQQTIKSTLTELVPLWLAEPATDWKRVVRPTGPGNFSINIEPYRGLQSWISFRKKILGKENLLQLEKVIRANQPELLGYAHYPSGSQIISQDALGLAIFFCKAVVGYIDTGDKTEAAIDRVITEIDYILEKNGAIQEILTPLSGLKLPENIQPIELDGNIILRNLTVDEISELGSNDVSSDNRHDIVSRFVTTAILVTREIKITITEKTIEHKPDLAFMHETQEQIQAVLHSLHLLKAGRVGIVASFSKLKPPVLPIISGQSTFPLIVNPFEFMELTNEEIESFLDLYKKLVANKRDEVKIAVTRLLDAESRLSPVDSLLDAVIGLEVLLNPNDYAELSFRVALNYAYLGKTAERRKRYENVRDIQKTRNRVVHGGLNLFSKDSAIIQEHAELAKQCLRNTIVHFLNDKALEGTKKLDADFWLDRVIPPQE